ncbi:xanthine dehydrogenase [Aureococcus anophagefferens]|nr:xanthine dehydrogenase [Aureococcus anophagefferens]
MARAVRCATDGGAGGAALTSAELKARAHFSDDGSGKGRKLGLRRGALRVVDDHVVLKTTSSTTTDDRVVLKTTSSTKTDDRVVLKTTSSTKTVSGAFATPLQKHFHMETHSARCVPGEGSGCS